MQENTRKFKIQVQDGADVYMENKPKKSIKTLLGFDVSDMHVIS